MAGCFALLGWSLQVIESARKLGRPYVVVSFPDFESYAREHDIPFVPWNFNEWSDQSNSLLLAERLREYDVDVAVPLFEETVEWAGALNSIYRNDPRVLNRALLFRNKAMMKRKALLGGLRVGLFEEVFTREQVQTFLKRLNEAQLQLPGEEDYWVHLKPFAAAGTVGHKLIRSQSDIMLKIDDDDFPCLIESHLPGREFSCEAFIHGGEVKFLNITEYVHLGHSNFAPPGTELEAKRPVIKKAVEKLVKTFGIEYGMIHPEWFIDADDEISFGEVAARIPGGHILELSSKAFDYDALAAFILCHDPKATPEEIAAVLPSAQYKPEDYWGCVMVYPEEGQIERLEIPDELLEDPYYVEHTLVPPISQQKVQAREGFGNHFGTVFFRGPDPERMREILLHYEGVAFYV